MSPAWRFYFGLYAGSRRTIVLSTALTLTQVTMTLPIAVLLSRLFNSALTTVDLWKIGGSALMLITLYMVGDALALISNHLSLRTTKSVVLVLRKLLIEGIYRTPIIHAPASQIGRIHAALVHDTERVDVMSNSLLSRVLPSLLSSVGMLAVLAWLSWQLCLVAILVVPSTWAIARLLRQPLQRRIDRFRREFENFSTATFASLHRRDLASIQGVENAEIAMLIDHSRNVRDAGHRVAWIGTANSIAQGEAGVITGILVLLAGSALIASGVLTVGVLIAFYFALSLFRSNLSNLFGQLPAFVDGQAALEHLFPFLQEHGHESYGGTRDIAFQGEVVLENVSFGYGDERVLMDASMVIRPGEVTALSGRSGAGKTTLANLILGLIIPSTGQVLADRQPYAYIKLADLRARIGYAGQDPVIFAATLRDNLAFGAEGLENRFAEALAIAGATEFVSVLPAGFDTWLGEKGTRLSGGQRQRLSITRAVLRRPTLLVLDEPTNHLGSTEVKALLARFRAAFPRTAILIISHDSSLFNSADRIYTLEKGTLRLTTPTGLRTLSLAER